MPQVIDDIDENDEGQLDAKGLRAKLADAAKRANKAESELQTYRVKDVLTEKGFTFVKPEDLADTPLDKIEERAAALQKERTELRESVVRDIFQSQGLEGDDLESVVQEFIGARSSEDAAAEATQRVRSLNQLESTPVPAVKPENLHGYDAIYAAEQADEAKRQRRR